MAQDFLKPLGGHAVLLLLVQLALLLVVARLGAELCKRMGLPAVVGELASGIALGPSVLPPTGGVSKSQVSDYHFEVSYPRRRSLLTVHRIETMAAGRMRGKQ